MSIIFVLITIFTVPLGIALFNIKTVISESAPVIENYNVAFKDITYDELNNYAAEMKNFVVVFYQTGCPHCDDYMPVYEEVLNSHKNNVPSYKLNLAELTNSEFEEFYEIYSVSSTPTTVYFENGSELDRFVGNLSEDTIVSKLESWDVINEC